MINLILSENKIPQIAPLIWNIIFLTTSIILIITLSKVYFTLRPKESKEAVSIKKDRTTLNKTWIW